MTGVGNRTPKTKKRPRRAKKGHRRQNAYVRAGVIITFYKENGPGVCVGRGIHMHVCGRGQGLKSCNRVSFEFYKVVAMLCDCCKILKQN